MIKFCHLNLITSISERPVEGMLKLNVDAAMFSNKGLVGVGCVLGNVRFSLCGLY